MKVRVYFIGEVRCVAFDWVGVVSVFSRSVMRRSVFFISWVCFTEFRGFVKEE